MVFLHFKWVGKDGKTIHDWDCRKDWTIDKAREFAEERVYVYLGHDSIPDDTKIEFEKIEITKIETLEELGRVIELCI